MISLYLRRKWFTEAATEGELELDGAFECYTLEDRSRKLRKDMHIDIIRRLKIPGQTAVPTGRYPLELYNSPKHGPDTLQLVGVPGFTNIQIHPANKAEELLGCIAPGNDRTAPDDNWIGQSRIACEALEKKVIPRMKAGEDAWIEIVEED